MKKLKGFVALLVFGLLIGAQSAFAVFTLPELPVTDLETAGAAVAGLVAVYVVIRAAIKMIKTA